MAIFLHWKLNRIIVPWSVISLEPKVNFTECFLEAKSGKFSNVSSSLELLSSILHSVFIGQDKTTANSSVKIMVNVVSICIHVLCLAGTLNLLSW